MATRTRLTLDEFLAMPGIDGARRVLSGSDVLQSVHAPGLQFAVADLFER